MIIENLLKKKIGEYLFKKYSISENKIEIIKTIWTIILSDGNSDMYEENLMRRLAGLLYIDDRTIGEIILSLNNLR